MTLAVTSTETLSGSSHAPPASLWNMSFSELSAMPFAATAEASYATSNVPSIVSSLSNSMSRTNPSPIFPAGGLLASDSVRVTVMALS
eukprot:2003631-Rhodomonas_salina.1